MLLHLCRFLSWKIVSSLFLSVHPTALCLRAQPWRLTVWSFQTLLTVWPEGCYAILPCPLSWSAQGDNNRTFLSVVRIKWAIIWKCLESGNTHHYIRVCFYERTASCLDHWKSLLVTLLVSNSAPLKSLSQYETKGIFLRWISDYGFFEFSKMTLYCLYDKVHIS